MTYCEVADKILTDWYLGRLWINGHSQTPDECEALLRVHQANCAKCQNTITAIKTYKSRFPEQDNKMTIERRAILVILDILRYVFGRYVTIEDWGMPPDAKRNFEKLIAIEKELKEEP